MQIKITDIGVLFGVAVPQPWTKITLFGETWTVTESKWTETNTDTAIDGLELTLIPDDMFRAKNEVRAAILKK